MFRSLPFLGKSSKRTKQRQVDDIPDEITISNTVDSRDEVSSRGTQENNHSRECRHNLKLNQSNTTSGHNQDENSFVRLSMDSTGIKNALWLATEEKSELVKSIDELCMNSVVKVMSRDRVAQKKLLDDFLNHGEF